MVLQGPSFLHLAAPFSFRVSALSCYSWQMVKERLEKAYCFLGALMQKCDMIFLHTSHWWELFMGPPRFKGIYEGHPGGNPDQSQFFVSWMREPTHWLMGPSTCLPIDPTWSILIIPVEPWVTIDVAGKTEFLVDTGAACCALTWLASPLSREGNLSLSP